jgi:hypothetical protein
MENIQIYFKAERAESLVFLAIGLLTLAAGIYFFICVKKPFYMGVAWPLIIIALIQLIVGAAVFVRTPKDIVRVEKMVSAKQNAIATEEIPRMETVMKNFTIYRWIEIVLAAGGLILILTQAAGSMGKGIGTGLFLQSLFMLAADYFAAKRGHIYLDWLQELAKRIN